MFSLNNNIDTFFIVIKNSHFYFKEFENSLMMIAVNDSDEKKVIEPEIIKSVIGNYSGILNTQDSSEKYKNSDKITLKSRCVTIYCIN